MRILLDTHIAIWAFEDSPGLPQKARSLLLDGANETCCSAVSVWEVQVKHAIHPDKLHMTAQRFVECCKASRLERLPILEGHVLALDTLVRDVGAPTHKDPFDRMLIAQAKAERLCLLTHDKALAGYGEECVLLV